MMAQTYDGPVRWVIVDDGPVPQPITFNRPNWLTVVLRPAPYWRKGDNTQARNLSCGLQVIRAHERVAIIEDDDYYAPGFLADVATWLESADLVGESFARYFNASTGQGRALRNHKHASLCCTAAKGAGLMALREAVKRRRTYIDMDLWARFLGSKALYRSNHVVGIKGLPGRGGIGGGHKADFGEQMNLRDWIGEDATLYGR